MNARPLFPFFVTRSCALLLVSATLLCGLLAGCGSGGDERPDHRVFPADFPVLHPQFRLWPSPARGLTVAVNDPTLMWPRTTGDSLRYDVRLSRDSSFPEAGTLGADTLAWTVFNPHQALAHGVWYWQYRVHGNSWSAVQHFRIADDAADAVSAPFSVFRDAIGTAHPRVLVTGRQLSAFRQSTDTTADVRAILREADGWLNKPLPDDAPLREKLTGNTAYQTKKLNEYRSKHLGFGVRDAELAFSQAFILTGDNRYAAAGVALANRVGSWDPKGPSGFSDFGDGACMEAMALAYDNFYDRFTAEERQRLLEKIKIRGEAFYEDWVNVVDAKVLSNHVWQFLLHNLFQTAVAVHGELPEADRWLNYLYELWLARAPVLGGPDGGWVGGASYFSINVEVLLDISTVIKQYTGFDFINHRSWFKGNAYWLYYAFPPGSGSDGFGDNSDDIAEPGALYLSYADALSRLTGSRVAATYAHKIETTRHYTLSQTPVLRWFRLRYLSGIPRPDTLADGMLPHAMDFPDAGLVEMHSNLSHPSEDLMIGFRSSPWGTYGHMLADQNTFNVLYGGKKLFYLTGHKVAMQDPVRLQWYKATIGHNGVLVDGKGQPFGSEAYGWIPRFIDGKTLSYAVGDASMAYGRKGGKDDTGLRHFRRHLLFLHPNMLVIYDEMEADRPVTWNWLIHSPARFELDTAHSGFAVSEAGARAVGKLFTQEPVHWALFDTMTVKGITWTRRKNANGKYVDFTFDAWHLRADNRVKARKMRILTVLHISPDGVAAPQVLDYFRDEQGNITVGNWTLKAVLDTAQPALLTAVNKAGTTVFASGGGGLKTSRTSYEGTPGAAKLAEQVDGKWYYAEASDSIPQLIKEIPPAAELPKSK